MMTLTEARVTVWLGVVTVTCSSPGELAEGVQVNGAAVPLCVVADLILTV